MKTDGHSSYGFLKIHAIWTDGKLLLFYQFVKVRLFMDH
jgi:hypothetical protein